MSSASEGLRPQTPKFPNGALPLDPTSGFCPIPALLWCSKKSIDYIVSCCVLQDRYDDERNKMVFHNTTTDLQDQDRFVWSETGLVLIPTVSDYVAFLNSTQDSLSLYFTPHIHLIILISAQCNASSFSLFTFMQHTTLYTCVINFSLQQQENIFGKKPVT